ncbi:MAG TPA: ABC transporter [Methylothermaceae bacterium]|nr:ABC transporter [Methylothermaceae bacterium]
MKIDRHIHQQIRLQNWLFTVLFLILVGLVAWLSQRYYTQWDWTAAGRHTLSGASRKVLQTMEGPITITAYAREDNQLRDRIRSLVLPYQRSKADVKLVFVNPDLYPDKVRELGITMDGELVIEFRQRREKIHDLSETALTNALLRLAGSGHEKIVFVTGHGERNPTGDANFDLGQFGRTLQQRGMTVTTWNPVKEPQLPEDTTLLVIASPQVAYLPGEVALVREYLERGGNLWWLAEPGDLKGLEALTELLGVEFLPGVVVDPTGTALGIADPTFALVVEYPPHPITRNFQNLTLFPRARALEATEKENYIAVPFLRTMPRAWTELGELEGKISFNPDQGEREGPLTLALALSRDLNSKDEQARREQRIVLMGDGDFLTNTYLGNGGNLDLGLNIVQWLSHNDQLIDIPAKTAPDTQLQLSSLTLVLIGLGFLVLLPVALLGSGLLIWWRRRRA